MIVPLHSRQLCAEGPMLLAWLARLCSGIMLWATSLGKTEYKVEGRRVRHTQIVAIAFVQEVSKVPVQEEQGG